MLNTSRGSSSAFSAAARERLTGDHGELRHEDVGGIDTVAGHCHVPRVEPGTFPNREHHARQRSLVFVARFVDLGGHITLLAVVALEQLGDDEWIGEQLTLQFLLLDDLVELVEIDSGCTFEGEYHLVRASAG